MCDRLLAACNVGWNSGIQSCHGSVDAWTCNRVNSGILSKMELEPNRCWTVVLQNENEQ